MTDKEQIMIDDVDVKNCNFFLSSNKYCGLYSTGCRFVPDCDYKQLARKTQECIMLEEEKSEKINLLEQVIKALYPNADDDELFEVAFNAEFIDKAKTIAQECEDLKLCLQQSKDNNKSTLKLLENKHAECEELKRKVELMTDCPDCKVDEYKEALKEIEELVTPVANKNPVYNCWELLNKCDKCKSKKDCGAQSPYYVVKQVLDIIGKVNGGK